MRIGKRQCLSTEKRRCFMEKIDLNVKKLKQYEKDLINYGGYLPSLVRWGIDIQYIININKSENAKSINERIAESRYYDFEELWDEFVEWCDENPQFSDLLPK